MFWISLAVVIYIYIGYPVLIFLLSRLFPHPVCPAPIDGQCAVVISAYNEADTLPAKLRALLSGPHAERITEIWVGSDGSDDHTAQAVEAIQDPRIHVVSFDRRRGKPSVLNDLVPRCRSPFIVFTDARQELDPHAIPRLLENFADERVGAVSGELIFRNPGNGTATASGMNAYWRYEKCIRRSEGRFRSVPGATGALYAIRRECYVPIRPDILLDDVAIPMRAVLQGKRCVFEENAVVYDIPSVTGKAEETRKRRTIAGNIQLVTHSPALLNPWRNPIWFEFISHKMVRLLSPFLLLALLTSNAWLVFAGECSVIEMAGGIRHTEYGTLNTAYLLLFLAQVLFYLLAVIGLRSGSHSIVTAAPAMFLRLNWATLLAWGDAMKRRYRVDWQRA